MRQRRRAVTPERIARECIAARLRMINRVVTKMFDDALRSHGLRTSQFNILTAIARRGTVAPSPLGAFLRLEKSTLSRDVKLMVSKGWLEKVPGSDARAQNLRVTRAGWSRLSAGSRGWAAAQRRAAAVLGAAGVARIVQVANRIWASSKS